MTNYSWLQKLEEKLERNLSEFLIANPRQEFLINQQKNQDILNKIEIQQNEIQIKANKQRSELISLANEVKRWQSRLLRAKAAQEKGLEARANEHLKKLIRKGEKLWSSLEKLGVEFKSLQHKKQAIPLQYKRSKADIETEWTQFDVEEELNQLRRKNGFSD